MNRLNEIAARMAAIANEIDSATGDALVALEQEVTQLSEERASIEDENARRQQLRSRVAAGSVGTPAAVFAAPTETVEQLEERAFVGFLRGAVAQMRTNEQNFTLANNGNLLPVSIANRVIARVIEICPILADCDRYSTRGTLGLPVYGPKNVEGTDHDITVAYGSDGVDLTADGGAFTTVDLGGYLIGALTLVGESLINNADIDVTAAVINIMAEKIAAFVEGELIKGSGSDNNHCTGALSTTNTMNAESTSEITADVLISLQGKVPTRYQRNARWTMNPATWDIVKKLKDGEGRYLFTTDLTQAFPYSLLGKPVELSDNMPTIASAAKPILYGDYTGLSVNVREDVAIKVLREKYATAHSIGIVAWMELDSKVSNAQKLAALVMSVTA